MPTVNTRRFAQPDSLKAIDPTRLLEFFTPYRSYLTACGLTWPKATPPLFDYETLARILIEPDEQTPTRMVDALYFVHEMARTDTMDVLLEEAAQAGIALDADADTTPADIAAQVWLRAPDLLERMHAETQVSRVRSFSYHKSRELGPRPFTVPTAEVLEPLQAELDTWFAKHKRGIGSTVLVFDHGQKVGFLVRHGMPFMRKGSLRDGHSETVFYRPETHDILVYDRIVNQLAVHAGTKGERALYLAAFGRHLFGDPGYFPDDRRYTLDPLKSGDPSCLACADIDGLDDVKLVELHRQWGGPYGDIEIRKSHDYLASLAARGSRIPRYANLVMASFAVTFTGTNKPRTVKVRPNNVASYTRDDDSELVERWLLARGFIIEREDECVADPEQALAVA